MRLGLLFAEIGQKNGISVSEDEMRRAMAAHASLYGTRQREIFEYFRKNPESAEFLHGPIFEDKVVDFILELAKVEDRPASVADLQAATS